MIGGVNQKGLKAGGIGSFNVTRLNFEQRLRRLGRTQNTKPVGGKRKSAFTADLFLALALCRGSMAFLATRPESSEWIPSYCGATA